MKKQLLSLTMIGFCSLSSAFAEQGPTGHLSMIVAPAVKLVDWSSPKRLIRTYLGGVLKKNGVKLLHKKKSTAMGHGMAHFDCTDTSGEHHVVYTGMVGSADNKLYNDAVLKHKMGVGVLFTDFEDGHLQSNEDVYKFLLKYRGRKVKDEKIKVKRRLEPRYLKFAIDAKQCDQVVAYYKTFADIALGEPASREQRAQLAVHEKLHYGLILEPFEMYQNRLADSEAKLGGGCTSVAAGFLKAADLYPEELNTFFKRDLTISKNLIGSKATYDDEGREANIFKISMGKLGNKWVHSGEENIDMSWYDPEKMWSFLDGVHECTLVNNNKKHENDAFSTCTPEIQSWLKRIGFSTRSDSTRFSAISHDKEVVSNITGTEFIKE